MTDEASGDCTGQKYLGDEKREKGCVGRRSLLLLEVKKDFQKVSVRQRSELSAFVYLDRKYLQRENRKRERYYFLYASEFKASSEGQRTLSIFGLHLFLFHGLRGAERR